MPPYIPRAICTNCKVGFRPKKNGIDLEARVDGTSYYKVAADLYECPSCKTQIYLGFGRPMERHDDRYDKLKVSTHFNL